MFAVKVVAPAVEHDGGDAGSGDEVEGMLLPGGEMTVVQPHADDTKGSGYYLVV